MLLRRFLHLFLLTVIPAIVFSNTLGNAYHLDSIHRVQLNTEIEEFWPPARFFTDLRTGSTVPQIAEYRPLMPLSHAINNEIARATDTSRLAGFHVGNIAIHIASSILVYFMFGLLIENWGRRSGPLNDAIHPSHQAFVAALIFAVHPIAASAVNYIAGRDLLLMVFFFLASMLVYFNMRKTGDSVSGWVISQLLLCLAILSKQAAIMGFGLVFLFEWIPCASKLWNWRLWVRTILFAVPTAGYFIFRWLWIVGQNPDDTLRTAKGLVYPLTMLDVHVFYYLRNFVWPFEMRALAKVEMIETILTPTSLAGLFFIIATLITAWWFRKRQPLVSFSILAYWLLFSLTSSVFPFRYVVSDYRQYLPLVFLALLLTLWVISYTHRIFSLTFLSGLVVYFSFSSHHINTHWATEISFWGQSVKYGAVALAHNNYGLAVAANDPALAEQHYLQALKQNPYHIYANINLGLIYLRQGKPKAGMDILYKVVEWNPDWALAHHWLSYALNATGKKKESIKEAQRAANLDPRSLKYQYQAARALQAAGRHAEAISYLKRIIDLNTNFQAAGFWLGFAYQKTAQPQRAINSYRQFLVDNPKHVQSHFNLAYQHMINNECETAIEHFNKVLALTPGYRETHLHLSRCYVELGDEQLATQHKEMYQQ